MEEDKILLQFMRTLQDVIRIMLLIFLDLVVHELDAYLTFVPHSNGKYLLGIEAKDVFKDF